MSTHHFIEHRHENIGDSHIRAEGGQEYRHQNDHQQQGWMWQHLQTAHRAANQGGHATLFAARSQGEAAAKQEDQTPWNSRLNELPGNQRWCRRRWHRSTSCAIAQECIIGGQHEAHDHHKYGWHGVLDHPESIHQKLVAVNKYLPKDNSYSPGAAD